MTVPISATNLDRPRHVRFPPLATELRTLLEVRFEKAEVYPNSPYSLLRAIRPRGRSRHPRRLGTTRTRTDADGSRAIRNGRFQRPVPQLRRQKHQS